MESYQSTLGTDINSSVVKITTDLQSHDLGLQCEAIAEFSNVVKKSPFPVVINPIFVRVVEAFQKGPNYLRTVVLKSCAFCEEHLSKLTCAKEIINNLSHIMVSNDFCARAHCLKLLGLLHPIFSSDKSVHHMIIMCLDSQYEVELQAAVEASTYYASISKDFANGLCSKLCGKLQSLNTDLNVKLQLIKLAKQLHHEDTTIVSARNCLIKLLNGYQSLDFVITLLDTLTVLATNSSVHVSSQIEILLDQLQKEDRDSVITAILENILTLAKYNSNIWKETQINTLCQYYNKSDPNRKNRIIANCKIIEFFTLLGKSCPTYFDKLENESLLKMIECASAAALIESNFIEVYELNFSAINFLFLVSINTNSFELAQHTLNTYRSNMGNLWQKSVVESFSFIQKSNFVILKLMKSFSKLISTFLEQNISFLLNELSIGKFRQNLGFSVFCRFISNFCSSIPFESDHNLPTTEQVLGILSKSEFIRTDSQVLGICSFVFQLAIYDGGHLLSDPEIETFFNWIDRWHNDDIWLVYRLGRMANKFGQHRIAYLIYERILGNITSLQHSYWIRGLIESSRGENMLTSLLDNNDIDEISGLMLAQKHFYKSSTFFKCSKFLWFSNSYVRIRCHFLTAIYTLIVTLNQYGLKRTPSDNNSNAKLNPNSANFIFLMESKVLFESNIAQITELINNSVDADWTTIEHLRWLQKLSSLFVQTLQAIITDYSPDVEISFSDHRLSHLDYWLKRLCDEISCSLNDDSSSSSSSLLNNDSQIGKKIKLLATLASNAIRINIPFPRYMFQKLQNTDVRLMATLNGKTINSESNMEISLRSDQGHILHVYGVIQQQYKLGRPIRTLKKMKISVGLSVNNSSLVRSDAIDKCTSISTNSVKLNNDYFSSDLMFDLKNYHGRYLLSIKAFPIDSFGQQWQTKSVINCNLKIESQFNGTIQKMLINRQP